MVEVRISSDELERPDRRRRIRRAKPAGERRSAPRRLLRLLWTLASLYIVIGLGFGIARFGWGAMVAAMAEPQSGPFMAGLTAAAFDGAVRVVTWAPTLIADVLLGGDDLFAWMLYS
jgi:hypothetical protein